MNPTVVLLTCTIFLFSPPSVSCYNVGDHVPLYVNKVGPLNNPSETYHYYDLPFCTPDPLIHKTETIGEVLSGDRLSNTLYHLNFRLTHTLTTLCNKRLKLPDIAKFRTAVLNDFYFQMYYDEDLPFWGFIGKVEQGWTDDDGSPKYFLFKHVHFDAVFNQNLVIGIRAFSDPSHAVDITEDVEIDVEFTYSVNWTSTSQPYQTRMEKYAKASFLPSIKRVQWFSFVTSVVIIMLLMGFLALLLMRRLNNDLRMCTSVDDDEEREVGWKYLHGDAFRCPSNLSLFSAVLGIGTQLLTVICILFVLVLFGIVNPYNRGALLTLLVIFYALTSVVSGFVASHFHNQFSETGWGKSVFLAGILYIGPLVMTVTIVNSVAIVKGSTAALPFGTILVVFIIFVVLVIPFLSFGGFLGHSFRSEFSAPCATKQQPRDIPRVKWFRNTASQMFLAGLLPFSAIIIQLHHLFSTIWGYKIYTLPGILFITFLILVILTAILSIGLTFVQLSAEDHRWWWRSVLCGGSTAIFMFGYGIYFYTKSKMDGLMQLVFFFGYSACLCYAFFLVLGTISFCASLLFVRYIYRATKSE